MKRYPFSHCIAAALLATAASSLAQEPVPVEEGERAEPKDREAPEQAAAAEPEEEGAEEAATDVPDSGPEPEPEVEPEQPDTELEAPPDSQGVFAPYPEEEPGEQGFVSDAIPGDVSPRLPLHSGVRAPGSTAFSILDLLPGQVQKPSASPPLSLAIARPLHVWDGPAIPLNLSVELSPYWLASHPALDYRDYVNSGFFARLYQNMTLSLGTSTEDWAGTSLAAGIRTGIDSRSHGCPQLDPLQDEYLEAVSREKLRAMDSAVADGGQLESFDPVSRQFKQEWLRDRTRSRALKQATQQCTRKRGFAMDAAFAAAFSFPDRDFDRSQLSAYSTWLTFAALGDAVSAVPMLRFKVDQLDRDNARSVFDLGGRLLLAVQRFAFSAEFVYRLVVDKPAGEEDDFSSDYYLYRTIPMVYRRAVGDDDWYYLADIGVDAALAEGIWLSLTVGKGFADLTADELFVKTSLAFDLGERTLRVDPDATGRQR